MLIHISNFEYYSLNSFREVVKIIFGGTKRKLLLWTEGISGIKRYSNMARSLHQKQKVTQRKRLVRYYFVFNFILNHLCDTYIYTHTWDNIFKYRKKITISSKRKMQIWQKQTQQMTFVNWRRRLVCLLET